MLSQELRDAYARTSYRICTGRGSIELRIGRPSPALDALLMQHGAHQWAFITAHNPASVCLSPTENESRHEALLHRLRRLKYATLPGVGVGDDGAWPGEQSVFVFDMGHVEAARIGQEFGQHAVVIGHAGQSPQLLFMEEE